MLQRAASAPAAVFEAVEVAAHVQAVHEAVMGFYRNRHHQAALRIGFVLPEGNARDAADAVGFVAGMAKPGKRKPGNDGVEKQVELEVAVSARTRGNRAGCSGASGIAGGKIGQALSFFKAVVGEAQVFVFIQCGAAAVQKIVEPHFIAGNPKPEFGDAVRDLHGQIKQGCAKRDAGRFAGFVESCDFNPAREVEIGLAVIVIQLKNRTTGPGAQVDAFKHGWEICWSEKGNCLGRNLKQDTNSAT